MRLLGNRILVKPDQADEISKGGIIIPEQLREEKNIGIVMQVSEKVEGYKPGDFVIFLKHAGSSFPHNGEDMRLMFPTDIIGKV